jgi:hypothetical protein
MKKISNQFLLKLTLPALVVFIILLLVLVIWPIRADILDLKSSINDERVELEKQYLNGQLLKETKTQYVSIEPDLPKLYAVTLKPGQELHLITTLEDLAKQHNLEQIISLDDLASKPGDKDSTVTILPTRVELEGRFADLVGYLADTELLDFYINWQKVNIKANQVTSRPGNVLPKQAPGGVPEAKATDDSIHITLSGETYWRK